MAIWKRDYFSERAIRLGTGLLLFTFAFTHFFNAGMGLFGIETANNVQRVIGGFWRFPPIQWLLFCSLAVHAFLGLKRLAWRRNWRLPAAEAWQLCLALLIPLWLIRHVVAVIATVQTTGHTPTYGAMYLNLWSPLAIEQTLLVLFVWGHGCLGVFMLLRVRPWFPHWRDAFFFAGIAVPMFALTGFLAGMREANWLHPNGPNISGAQITIFNTYYANGQIAFWTALGIAAFVIVFRYAKSRFDAELTVKFADGPTLRVASGATLLEISRSAGVPHASVCGGKARCSTCRVRLLEGSSPQAVPNQAEQRLLSRIHAPSSVRLACQLVPTGEVVVQKLVDAGDVIKRENRQQDPFRWGVERRVTLLFVDIRGFTSISERNFAFDIVFVLNRFLTAMSGVIEANGGLVDKYLGDGLMAIFGTEGIEDGGGKNALQAAKAMGDLLAMLNSEFMPLLKAEIRIGIGLHTGPAILGRIGGGANTAALTALGDTVNTAARLEEMTKTFGAVCVASEATLQAAGCPLEALEWHDVPIRGQQKPLRVCAFREFPQIATT